MREEDARRSYRRTLYTTLVILIGILFASFHFSHLIADIEEQMGVLALVTGALLPFVFALCTVSAGYWFWRNGVRAEQLRHIFRWVLLGICGLTAVSGAFVTYEILEGARLTHTRYLLVNFATTGAVGGLLVGWYDAQNRRQKEQLRVFRKVVEHSGHCIMLTAPDGTIEYVNPQFEAQTGYSREEAIDETPQILNSGHQSGDFYEDMWETIISGEVWEGEVVNERKDGTHYWVHQTIAPVEDTDGTISHFVAINRDITELKEYESQLERRNDRLNHFASTVSHDLRNPLNVATGRIEILRDDCESEHLDIAKQALERMERLIDDVLTLARQGKTIDDTERVSLQAVSEQAWDQVSSTDAELSIRSDLAIIADCGRIQQLLENLFRNAIEHGGAEVTVRVGACDDGFYVEDTGEGLPEGTHDRLFESGFTTAEDGTGFGLAIVHQIVEAHGWEITATDGSVGGARFEITGLKQPTTVPRY